MSLVPDYDDSLSSDSSEEQVARLPEKPPKSKLPAPDFMGVAHNDPDAIKSSVFKNPFAEAESAKEAILQKHVKMVDAKDNVIVINGKKICWNYRKGRCRFGHNCKFAHDSDVQVAKESTSESQSKKVANLSQQTDQAVDKMRQDVITQQSSLKRKKRPGLTQGLVPGKKVMKKYMNQK